MIFWRNTELLLGIALVAVLAACSTEPLTPYATEVGPVPPEGKSLIGLSDERARFREIFCQVLDARGNELPDYRPCEVALTRVGQEPSGAGHPVSLGYSAAHLKALFVPGIGWDCFSEWLEPPGTAVQNIRRFGFNFVAVPVEALSSSAQNAKIIRNTVLAEAQDNEKARLVLIGYSKGTPDILEAIEESYAINGKEETAFIVRSNKRANLYNENIRKRILYLENDLAVGDYMMVVKNNYFWLKPTSEAGFIANGDLIEVLEILAFKELYGFRFAEVVVKMVDYPNQKPFETVLLLDTIKAVTPSLSYEEGNRLYQEVLKDYQDVHSKYKKFLAVKNNKYFNSLQVKFSYAITCHKSQGGQWNTVFVEQPYLPNGVDKEYLRWLYTAVTRAKTKLYLIGFKSDFFVGGE